MTMPARVDTEVPRIAFDLRRQFEYRTRNIGIRILVDTGPTGRPAYSTQSCWPCEKPSARAMSRTDDFPR